MQRIFTALFCASIVLIGGFLLVHAGGGEGVAEARRGSKQGSPAPAAAPAASAPAPSSATATAKAVATPVPAQVTEMVDGILAAVRSGRIEDLAVPIAWNELPPSFATEKVADPIAYWKKTSGDGEGRQILAVLASILDAGPVVVPVGRDVENAKLYVWPRFAEMALDKLSPEDEVQLLRLISPAELAAMRKAKRWLWWRLAIGADGTWHSFQKAE